jgi:hypothetical protein
MTYANSNIFFFRQEEEYSALFGTWRKLHNKYNPNPDGYKKSE